MCASSSVCVCVYVCKAVVNVVEAHCYIVTSGH